MITAHQEIIDYVTWAHGTPIEPDIVHVGSVAALAGLGGALAEAAGEVIAAAAEKAADTGGSPIAALITALLIAGEHVPAAMDAARYIAQRAVETEGMMV